MRFSRIVAIAATLFVLPAVAFASCTANVSVPAFSVAMKDLPVNYRFDLDSAALAKVADQNGMPGLKGEIPYGLTIGRYDLEVTVNTDSMRDGSGILRPVARCPCRDRIEAARCDRRSPFASGSCQRQAVLDHEAEHVEVFREAVRYDRRRSNARWASLIAAQPPCRGPQRGACRYLGPITNSLKPISMRSTAARATETRVSICHTVTPQYSSAAIIGEHALVGLSSSLTFDVLL